MATYKTISAPVCVEIDKIKGSRFLGHAAPVHDEPSARAFVDALRAAHPEARHVTYAFRLGPGMDHFRYSDDGEPRGTGGPPLLRHIDGRELKDVVVAVVRYFGGTKLGSGPLLRAYSDAGGAALDASTIVEVEVTTAVTVAFDYGISGVVRAVLSAHGLTPSSEVYEERAKLTVRVVTERVAAFVADVSERSAGQAEIEIHGAPAR